MPTDTNLTYAALVATVPSYLERDDAAFLAEVPTFVNLAENRMATDMKQQGFQATVTNTLPLTGVLAKPSWWKESISFSYMDSDGNVHPILLRNYQYCRNYWPNPAQSGDPVFYADYNVTHFLLVPTPAVAYQFELMYFARLQPLSEEHQSNWLTENAPQALLYATLFEAAVWALNATKQALYKGLYDEAKATLQTENLERLSDRSTVVTRP